MKKVSGIIAVVIVFVVGLYASGWAPRDVARAEGSLVGHWSLTERANVQVGGEAASDYYFGPLDASGKGRVILTTGDGARQEGKWRAVETLRELGADEVRVELDVMGRKQVVTVTFADDARRSMRMGGPLGLLKVTQSKLTYQNAETSPALFDVEEVRARLIQFGAL